MSDFTLITGGARSGKSTFAEKYAAHFGLPVIYIATAQIFDDEMAQRVKKHRQQRPEHWQVIEEPYAIRHTLENIQNKKAVVLLDCITLWLSNLLLNALKPSTESSFSETLTSEAEDRILNEVQIVAQLAKEITPPVIMVTNEVGQGIVPENPLARAYRDLAGKANQLLAHQADTLYWIVAGYPVEIKQSGQEILNSLESKGRASQ
ncbi:bifunctional adenosylcobinamide kinase/adenosylcobinamide-phosphate guanylyltransferase [Desulfitobacterium sp. AusDCA]|uniref:bifunctional adenosylcobinamide kinase/adenosylcobinamide-phosphate guanylyltransferase n=1 Tax=Desulfitobacterium sp. AusDCA TaxID=3240383 RepID=UPI003DA6F40E